MTDRFGRKTIFLVMASLSFALQACSLPRTAAVQSEVLAGSDEMSADFAVHRVDRAFLETYLQWPRAGQHALGPWPPSGGDVGSVIAAGDKVSLSIWDTDENSLLVPPATRTINLLGLTVDRNGQIFLPYVEAVTIAGLSSEAARRRLQQRLEEVSPSAQVVLTVEPGRNNAVEISSGVGAPGSYPIEGRNFTVLSLIADAGGVPASLRNPRVGLVRDGRRFVTTLEAIRSAPERDARLRGGDKLVVEEDDRFFEALGASGRQELIAFDRDSISAREAVAMVGGLSADRANPQGVLILREYPEEYVGRGPSKSRLVFAIDLTTADGLFSADRFDVAPGDLLLVTESPVTNTRTIFGLIGSAFGLVRAGNAI